MPGSRALPQRIRSCSPAHGQPDRSEVQQRSASQRNRKSMKAQFCATLRPIVGSKTA